MNNKTTRIKDIAVKANLSTGTVDRVLHNRGKVSEKAKQKILKIIEEMEYEPNLMARALGSSKIFQFAALIPDEQYDSYWHSPKIGVLNASRDLKQFGVRVNQYLFNPYNADSFIQQARKITEEGVDGIFLSPIFHKEALPFLKKWKESNIPFVLFNTEITDYEPLSYIGQDSYQSGLLAARLMHYGLPNPCSILIAHFDEDTSNAAHLYKKEQGFRNYFIQNNIDQKYNIIKLELDSSNSSVFIKRMEDIIENTNRLEGIFVTTSKAFEIASYLNQRHIKNIRIVGYDLLPINVYYLNTGAINFLINQNPKGQGYWGIHQLANHLVFKKGVPILKYLPLDIITKENVNFFLDDENVINRF
jgi:LacI family transcriptional regulator